jgi:hypothetical protein
MPDHGSAAVAAMALTGVPAAQPSNGEPETREGFYLRLALGGGHERGAVTSLSIDARTPGETLHRGPSAALRTER